MKQFAQCANCRQWYVEHAVTMVDILQGNGMRRTALWCQSCIREAEQRSHAVDERLDAQALELADDSLLSYGLAPSAQEAPGVFGELLQEHHDLMEEALLEEDDGAIASRIGEFVERGRTHMEQLDDPEQAQRLTNHLNYWQTFLKTLNP